MTWNCIVTEWDDCWSCNRSKQWRSGGADDDESLSSVMLRCL